MDSSTRNGRKSGAASVAGESERVAMTPSLHRVASPSPIKAKKRETQKPQLDVTSASVGALKLPTELFQLATSRTLAASHGQADLVLSKALDGIQAAATRLEAERTRLVIQSQELQIWDMAREEELGLLKVENEQLEQQLLAISEKVGKGLGRDGVLESLQFALRKARGERDAEMREADTLFNQLQDAKAAEQELRQLRDALTQALLGLEDDWSAVPLLSEEVRKMRARAASGTIDPTQLNQVDLTTLLRGLATVGKQGVQLQAELQTMSGEKTALATALDAAHAQLAKLQAEKEQLQQQPQAAAAAAGSPLHRVLPGAPGPQTVVAAAATAGGAAADVVAEAAALRAQVQELNAKLAEYRSYLAENQQEIEQLQGEIQRLQAMASRSSQHHHHHHRGGTSHHALQMVSGQAAAHLPASHTSQQQQPDNRPHANGGVGGSLKASSSQPLHASQQAQHHLPPHAPPQAVHGTPTRHHPSSSSPISTVNYASPPPHVAFGGTSAGAASPSQLHQQQVAADIAQKVAELQELAVRVQRQAAEREAELVAAHESELAALRSALEAAQAAAQQELEAVRAALVTQHVQDRRKLEARLQAAAEQQVQQREAALAAAHGQALTELNAQLTALAQQHVAALAEREAELAAQHAQALAAMEARLGDLHVEAVGAQAAAAAQALQEQAARLEAQHAQQLRELEERLVAGAKQQAEELEQRLTQQHAEAVAHRDAEVRRRHAERLAEQAAQLARLHADQAAALGMQHAEALADREAELTRLHSEALAVREATLLAEAEKQWREREAELREAFAAEVVEREARLAAAHQEQARAAAEELERLRAAVAEAAAREAELAARLIDATQEAQAQAEQALRVQLEEVAAAAEAEAVARAAAAHSAVIAAEAGKHKVEMDALRSQLLAEAEARQTAALDDLEQANQALQTRIGELESQLAQLHQQFEERSRNAGPNAVARHAQEVQAAVESVERRYVEVVARLGREHEQSATESRAAALLREANLNKVVERHAREAAEARREAEEAKRVTAERVGEMQDQLADLQSLLDRERRATGAAATAAAERLDLMEAELGALRAREEALQREVVPLREEVRRCRWLVRDTQTDLSEMEQELARYKAAASPPVSPGAPAAPGPADSSRVAPASPTASVSTAATRELHQLQGQTRDRDSVPAMPRAVGSGTALPLPAAEEPAASTSRSLTDDPGVVARNTADPEPRASPTAWADGEAVAWPSPAQPIPYRSQGGETSDPAKASSHTTGLTPLPPPPAPPANTPLLTQSHHEHTPVLRQGFHQQQQQQPWDPRASEQDLAAKLVRVLKAASSGGAEDSFAEEETEEEASPADVKRSSKRRPAAAPRRALLSEGGPAAAGGKLASVGGVGGLWSWATPQASSRSSAAAAQTGADAAASGRTVASASSPPRPLRRMTADDIPPGWDGSAVAMASLADWRSSDLVQRPSVADPSAAAGPGAICALRSTDAAAAALPTDAAQPQSGVVTDDSWGEMRGASPLRSPVPRLSESAPVTSPSRSAGQAEGGGSGSGSGSPVASVSTTSSYNSQTELCFVDEDEDDVDAQQRVLAAALAESRRVSMAEGQLPEPPALPPALVEIQQRRLSLNGGAGAAAPVTRQAPMGVAGPSELKPFRSEGGYSQVTGRATQRPDDEWNGDSSGEAEQHWQELGRAARACQDADGEEAEDFDMEATLSGPFAAMVIREAGSTPTAAGALDVVADEAEDEGDGEQEDAEEDHEDDEAEGDDRFDEDGTGAKRYGSGGGGSGGGGDDDDDDDHHHHGSVHDRDDSYSGSGHGHGQGRGWQHPALEAEGGLQQEDDMEATLSGPFPVLPPGMLLHGSGGGGANGHGAASSNPARGPEGNTATPPYGRAGSFDFVPGNRSSSNPTSADAGGGAGSSGGGGRAPSPLGLTDTVPRAQQGEQEELLAEGEEHRQAVEVTAAGRPLPAELEREGAASSGLSSPSYSRGGAADVFPPHYPAGSAQPHTQDGAEGVWRIWDGGISAGGNNDGTGEGLQGGLADQATSSSLASTPSPTRSQRQHGRHPHGDADAGGGSRSPHATSTASTPVPAFSASPQLAQPGVAPQQRMRSSDGIGSFRLSHAASPHQQQQPWYHSSVTAVPLMTPNPLYEDRGGAGTGGAGGEPSPPWSAADWSAAATSAHRPTHDDAPSMPSTPGSVSSPASGGSVTSPAPGAASGRAGRTGATGGSEDSEEGQAASCDEEEDAQPEDAEAEVDEGVPEAAHADAAVVALPPLRVSSSLAARDGARQPSSDTGSPSRYSTAAAASPGSAVRLTRQRSGKRTIQGREAGSSLSPTSTVAAEASTGGRRSSDKPARSAFDNSDRKSADAAAAAGSNGAAAATGDDATEARSLMASGASMGSSELRKRQRRRMGDFPSPLALSFALDSPAAVSPLTGASALVASAADLSAASPPTAAGTVASAISGRLGGASQPEPKPASPASPFDPLRQSWEFSCGVATPVSPGHRSRVQGHVVGHGSPGSHRQPRNSASPQTAHSPPQPTLAAMPTWRTALGAPGSVAVAAGARSASLGPGPGPSRPPSLPAGTPQASTPGTQLPPPAPLPTSAAEARARGRQVLGRVMGRVASLQGLCAHLSPAASGAGTPLVTSAPGSATGTPRRSVSSWSGTPALAAAQGTASGSSAVGPSVADTAMSAALAAPPAANVTTVTPEIIRQLLARHQQQHAPQHSLSSSHTQQQTTQSPPLLAPDDPDLVAGVMGALEELRSDLFELEKLHQLTRLQPPGAAGGAGAASRQTSAAVEATSLGTAAVASGRRADGSSVGGLPLTPTASSAPRLQPLLPGGSPLPTAPAVFGSSMPAPAYTGIAGLAAAPAVPRVATPGGNVDPALMAALAQTVQSQLAGQLGALQAKIVGLQQQNQALVQRGRGEGVSSPGSGAATACATPAPHAPGGPAATVTGGGSHIQQLVGLLTPATEAPVTAATATPSAASAAATARASFSLVAVASAAASGVERGAAAAAAATAIPVGGTAAAAGGTPQAPAWGGILVPPVQHCYAAEPTTPSMIPRSSPPSLQAAAHIAAAPATPMPPAQAEQPSYAWGHSPGLSTLQSHSAAAQAGLSGAVLWANAPALTPATVGLVPWASSATAVKSGFPSTGGSRSSGVTSTGGYSTASPHHHTSMSVYPYIFGHGGPGSTPGATGGVHEGGAPAWHGVGAGNNAFQAGMRPGLRASSQQPYSPEELSQLPPGVQLFAPPQLRAQAVAVAHEQQQHRHQYPWQMPFDAPGLGSDV